MAKRTSRQQTDGNVASDRPKRTAGRARQSVTPSDLAPAGPTDEDIRLRAYHRYLSRGGSHGQDFNDWLEAERELKKL